MARRLLALTLMLEAACFESRLEPVRAAPVLPFSVSGQRLHARHYAADGAEAFVTFYDTRLDLECAFQANAAGHGLRCVPAPESIVRVVYLDARCSQPVAPYSAGDGSGPVTGRWVSDLTGEHLYTLGEHVSDPVLPTSAMPLPALYGFVDGECRSQGHDCGLLGCGLTRLTPRTDVELVTAQVNQIEVGDGFLIDRIVADDGAALTLGARTRDKVACSFVDDGQCIPGRLATDGKNLFTDTTCADQALSPDDLGSVLAPLHDAAARYTVRMDGATVHVYELEHRSPAYYFHYGFDDAMQPQGACEPLPSDYPAYVRGAEVQSRFASAQRVRTGTGQLHVDHFALGVNGATLATSQFTSLGAPAGLVDERGLACRVVADEAGALRCFPELLNLYSRDYWADPQCQRRLFTPRRDAPTDTPYMFASNEIPGRWAFYTAVRYDGPLFQVNMARCEAAAGASVPLYRLGEKLAPTTLPLVTLE